MSFSDWIPPIITNLFTTVKEGNKWFYRFYSSRHDAFKDIDCLQAFNCVPEVNAVINMKANAFSNGRPKVLDDNGNEFPNEPIIKLLKSPNWFQAQKEFMKQTKLFHEIYGNEYLYGFFGVGFKFEDTKAIFSLPPNLIKSEYQEKASFFLFTETPPGVKYYLKRPTLDDLPIPNDQIIHLNDNRVTIKAANDKDLLSGESKLKALAAPINNIKFAYQSRGVILRDRGANGAWVTKSKDGVGSPMPLTPTEREEMQDQLKGYGTLDGQNQDIITNVEMAWIQRGPNNPSNLGLFTEIEEDFKKVQDAYGVPPEMFASKTGATFENQKIAERGMYVRTTIPEANEWVMGINARFYPDGKKKLIIDYSHLEIFQEDLKVKADAINSSITYLSKLLQDKQITQEEYRTELAKLGIGDGKPIPTTGDSNQQEIETKQAQATLRGSVGGVQGILAIQTAVSQGTATRDAALATLTIIYGFTDEQAAQILGNPQPQQSNAQQNGKEEKEISRFN